LTRGSRYRFDAKPSDGLRAARAGSCSASAWGYGTGPGGDGGASLSHWPSPISTVRRLGTKCTAPLFVSQLPPTSTTYRPGARGTRKSPYMPEHVPRAIKLTPAESYTLTHSVVGGLAGGLPQAAVRYP